MLNINKSVTLIKSKKFFLSIHGQSINKERTKKRGSGRAHDGRVRLGLVYLILKTKKFSRFLVISNLEAHT